MKVSVVIPARWASERFPGKMLALLGGRPLLWHAWSRVQRVEGVDEVIIAVDDDRIAKVAKSWGAEVVMTARSHRSGTERIASIVHQLVGDLVVNVQGDQCFIDSQVLENLVKAWKGDPVDIITPIFRIVEHGALRDSNVVKVVVTEADRVLYFSRSAVPFLRDYGIEDWLMHETFWGHIGVYGFKREVLEDFDKIPVGRLEAIEKLEQLRFLESGFKINALITDHHFGSVDCLEDLQKAEDVLRKELVC